MSKNNNNQNNNLAKQLSNQLNSKHKIDSRKDYEETTTASEVKEHNTKKIDHNSSEKVSKFNPELKQEALNTKNLLARFLFGLSFGASSFFPTCSNSTLVSGFNITDQFKDKMYSFFRPGGFYNWLLYLLWLLPLFVTSIISFIVTFVVCYFIISSGYGPSILLGASGFSFAFVIIYFMIKKIKLPIGKKNNEFYVKNAYRKWVPWLIISLAIVFIIVIAIIGRFAWHNDGDGYILNGYSFASHEQVQAWLNSKNVYLPKQQFETSFALILLAAGFFAGFANFVPGLSSGLFLNLFGSFQKAMLSCEVGFGGSIASQNTNVEVINQDWGWPNLIVIFTGYAFGVVANIFFIRWLENKSKRHAEFIYFGLICGSIISNFIGISPVDYNALGSNGGVLGLGIALFFIIILATFVVFYLLHRFNFIHLHDKLSPKQKNNA